MSSDISDEPAPEVTADVKEETQEGELRAELKTRVKILREENRRLRGESCRLTRTRYRQTALGLLVVGAVAALGGLVFPAAREVFVVLAGVCAFGAVLTYYLTPEGFIAASVASRYTRRSQKRRPTG